MGAFTRSIVLFCAYCMCCLCAAKAADDVIDPNWLKPGALDRYEQRQRHVQQSERSCEAQVQPTIECNCPPSPESSEAISEDQKMAPVFYRKLVRTLFDRDTLQPEPSGAAYYNVLSLKVTNRQLDKLLNGATSVRELDVTLAEILEQSNNGRRGFVLQESRCERLHNFLLEFIESKILYHIQPFAMLLFGWFLLRVVSRFTRLHPIIVFLLLMPCISVVNNWEECNEKLARKSLQTNGTATTSYRWFHMFTRTNPATMCDPLQVIVETTVSIQGVYFSAMFKQFINVFEEHTQKGGFFQKGLVGLLLLGFAYVLLTTMLQVGVSSGFKMFGNVVTAGMQYPRQGRLWNRADEANEPPQPPPAMNLNIHIGGPVAGGQTPTPLYRLESQRIEIVPEEKSAPTIEEPMPNVENTLKEIDTNETEHTKEKPPSESAPDAATPK